VIAPSSVGEVQGATSSPVEIGRRLDARDVVETTLSPEPNQRLRISARLIRAADAELAWAEVRTTAHENPYPGIDALFDAVLARFASAPGTAAQRPATAAGPPLPAAVRGTIESARMLITHMHVASIDRARVLLAAVTAEYPAAADAWALRGRACVRRLNYADLAAPPLVAELETCLQSALALKPDHVDALALRALVSHWNGALPSAELQFREVLRAAPNHTNARLGFAWLLSAQGRFDEALTETDAARSFDPMSLNILFNRAAILALARRHDEARDLYETGLGAGDESLFAMTSCGGNELIAGKLERAEALYRRAAELAPAYPSAAYGQAFVAAARGDKRRARALARAARGLSPLPSHFREAELNSYLRDRRATLAALRRSAAAMESARFMLGVSGAFEWLADDPEFIALLAPLGLGGWCGVRSS
jgi:tetratricopeptide (TPR) repeat protein